MQTSQRRQSSTSRQGIQKRRKKHRKSEQKSRPFILTFHWTNYLYNLSEDTLTFNHYTDKEGRDAIEKDQMIRESVDTINDAAFGQGVYGTSMSPREGRKAILENNYDGAVVSNAHFKKRADYVFSVEVPRDKVEVFENTGRDILVHNGDLDLSEYDYKIRKVPENPK